MSTAKEPTAKIPQPEAVSDMEARARACYLPRLTGVPFTTGNSIRLLRNGDAIFPAMLDAIAKAKVRIEMLTFVYWTGDIAREFANAMATRAAAGVKVRVMLDAYGAAKMLPELLEKMESSGVDVCWFRPLNNLELWRFDNRTHRKVLVCDDRIGFTGGVGIASEWEGNARNPDEWRDTHVEVRGPAVHSLAGAFWDNWLEMRPGDLPDLEELSPEHDVGSDKLMIVRSAPRDTGSDASVMLQALLTMARREIMIATPYFVLDELFRDMLCEKSRSGVRTIILIPGQHIDKRYEWFAAEKDFSALFEAGVEIYRYEKTMLHQKIILIDDDYSFIGSTNFNQRSLRKDAEVMMVIAGRERNRELREHLQEDLEHAHREDSASWAKRPVYRKIAESLVRPFEREL